MPSSRIDLIQPIMSAITNRHQSHSRIESVLEVGVGWGKYGVLLREYLSMQDIMEEDNFWGLRLDCVEVCPQYLRGFKSSLYTHMYPVDIREFCKDIVTWAGIWTWDLVLLIEILEHMPKEDGHFVIKTLLEYARWIVISTPRRLVRQPVELYHEQEQHVSLWSIEDFEQYSIDEILVDGDQRGTLALILKGGRWEERPPKR